MWLISAPPKNYPVNATEVLVNMGAQHEHVSLSVPINNCKSKFNLYGTLIKPGNKPCLQMNSDMFAVSAGCKVNWYIRGSLKRFSSNSLRGEEWESGLKRAQHFNETFMRGRKEVPL
jgi:hypothetical protein